MPHLPQKEKIKIRRSGEALDRVQLWTAQELTAGALEAVVKWECG